MVDSERERKRRRFNDEAERITQLRQSMTEDERQKLRQDIAKISQEIETLESRTRELFVAKSRLRLLLP